MAFNSGHLASTAFKCDEHGDLACYLLGKWKMSGNPTNIVQTKVYYPVFLNPAEIPLIAI